MKRKYELSIVKRNYRWLRNNMFRLLKSEAWNNLKMRKKCLIRKISENGVFKYIFSTSYINLTCKSQYCKGINGVSFFKTSLTNT